MFMVKSHLRAILDEMEVRYINIFYELAQSLPLRMKTLFVRVKGFKIFVTIENSEW